MFSRAYWVLGIAYCVRTINPTTYSASCHSSLGTKANFRKKIEQSCTWYILIVTILLILAGCGRQKAKFTPEELSWLVYSEGDTILYKDNQNQLHPLVVDYRTDLSQIRNYYPIEAEIEIFSPDNDEKFRIYLLKDEETFKRYLRLGEVYRSFDLAKPAESFVIDDKTYSNVYVFSEDTTDDNTDVWKVYYNREHGIIKYLKKDNKVFKLANISTSS